MEELMPEGDVAETMPQVEEAFEEIEVDAPLVGIIMGSVNDKPKMQPAGEALHEAGIRYEVRVMSAPRGANAGPEGDHRRCGDVGRASGGGGRPHRPARDRRPAHGQDPWRAGCPA